MFGKLFGKSKEEVTKPYTPEIMGLRLGASFELDSLALKLVLDELTIESFDDAQIIQAAGVVDMDGTWVYRFYTDDDAWLQVIAEGGQTDEHVVDVKFFHYYDTQDVQSKAIWDSILNEQIGQPQYELDGKVYDRVWTSASEYHNPVHMAEKTYDESGDYDETDQFTMLFERPLSDGRTETLFVSAEESVEDNNQVTRCLVLSTGITLTPSQITIHG